MSIQKGILFLHGAGLRQRCYLKDVALRHKSAAVPSDVLKASPSDSTVATSDLAINLSSSNSDCHFCSEEQIVVSKSPYPSQFPSRICDTDCSQELDMA